MKTADRASTLPYYTLVPVNNEFRILLFLHHTYMTAANDIAKHFRKCKKKIEEERLNRL